MKIFIVGNSRSGTTLMARILKRHSSIYILNETHFMEEFIFERKNFDEMNKKDLNEIINRMLTIQDKGYYRKTEIDDYPISNVILRNFEKSDKNSFSNLVSLFFSHEASKHNKSISGDQTPRHIFYVNEIKTMFPEAKFVNMVRDPRGVLCSQKYKWKAEFKKGVPLFETVRTYLNYHPILMSFLWNKGIKNALDVNDIVKNDSWLNVKFEDLTNNPREIVMNVCDFLNVEFMESMLDVSVSLSSTNTDEGMQGISKNIADKWILNLSSNEIFYAEKINHQYMEKFGYKISKTNPFVLKLFLDFIILPFQAIVILLMNYSRMGNLLNFLKKRLS